MSPGSKRVLAQLRLGPVTPSMFLLPDVVDGGKPIQRLAPRICELRQEGYAVETTAVKPTATYELKQQTSSSSTPAMFANSLPAHSPYRDAA